MKKWFVYILRCNDGTLYTGVTTNIQRRLHEHNKTSRGSKYTKARRPVNLVYKAVYNTRSAAQKAEYQIKQLTRVQKERLINDKMVI